MSDERRLKREPGDDDPPIVGWMVHTAEIAHAALYNLSQREDACDAAYRWGASITALAVHPQTLDISSLPSAPAAPDMRARTLREVSDLLQAWREGEANFDVVEQIKNMADAASGVSQLQAAADVVRDTAWMIECREGFTGWWDGRVHGGMIDCRFFNKDPNACVRFSRKEDAERTIAASGHSCQIATDHEWVDAAMAAQGGKDD